MSNIIIAINGAPNSGKDTVADLFAKYGFKHLRFKDCLYKLTADYYNLDVSTFINYATDRTLKDIVFIDKLSPRKMIINVAENIYKKKYGDDYFALMAINKINSNTVISDLGFNSELKTLEEFCVINNYKLFIINVNRNNTSFTNDSRSYITSNKYDNIVLNNNCNLNDLENRVSLIVNEINKER